MILDFVTGHARFPWHRQVPPQRELGAAIRFDHGNDADWLIVYDDLGGALQTYVPVARRVLIISEPPELKRYPGAFLRQFGTIVSPYFLETGPARLVQTNPRLPWFYGIGFINGQLRVNQSLEMLRNTSVPPAKRLDVSVVLSSKTKLPMHRNRLAFLDALTARLGERLHIFGTGFRPIEDKAQAIDPFAYHLVLENNDLPHFWTEKLADAFLGFALPLYIGTPDVTQYFDADSFIPLPRQTVDASVNAVEEILLENTWHRHLSAIKRARERLLSRYNLYAFLAELCATTLRDQSMEAVMSTPERLLPAAQATLAGRMKTGLRTVRRAARQPFRAQ